MDQTHITFSFGVHTKHLLPKVQKLQEEFLEATLHKDEQKTPSFQQTPPIQEEPPPKPQKPTFSFQKESKEKEKAELELQSSHLQQELEKEEQENRQLSIDLKDTQSKYEQLQKELLQYKNNAPKQQAQLRGLQQNLQHTQQELKTEQENSRTLSEKITQLDQKIQTDQKEHTQKEKELQQQCTALMSYKEKSWPKELLAFEEWILEHEDFCDFFRLHSPASNNNRIKILGMLGRFNDLEELWRMFSRHCSQEKRHASDEELQYAKFALSCFNLLETRDAAIYMPQPHETFQEDHCTDVSGVFGNKILQCLFPGLYSISGALKVPAIVLTTHG